jgi:hypothetical protein
LTEPTAGTIRDVNKVEEHKCLYEREWGKQAEVTSEIRSAVTEIKRCAELITTAVNALTIQVELNKQAIGRQKWLTTIIILTLVAGNIKIWFF